MSDLISHFREAIRGFRQHPVLIWTSVITLPLSAGVNLAMVGLIDRAILAPPSLVPDPERVFTLRFGGPSADAAEPLMTTTSYVAYRQILSAAAVENAAAFQRMSSIVLLEGEQLNVSAMTVSENYFSVLGVSPRIGRGFEKSDGFAGALPAALLSDAFWRKRFAGNPRIVGLRLRLGGLDYEIAGVMPPGFSGHSSAGVDLWVPFAAAMRNSPGWDSEPYRNITSVVVRLAKQQTLMAATQFLTRALDRPVALAPVVGTETNASERRIAWWLLAVSSLVFLAGLANSAILLIVRGARTRRQMRIRLAVGATPRLLVQRALAEGVLLSTIALALSFVLAASADEFIRRLLFPDLLERTASAAVGVVGALAAILAFLVITAASASQFPSTALRMSLTDSAVDGRGPKRVTQALLIAQTALSVILLAGAGFFGSSLYRLWNQDFGLRLDRVLVADFEPGPHEIAEQDRLFTETLQRVRSLQGVAQATTIDSIPFSGFNVPPISIPGRSEPPAVGQQLPFLTAATPEFFSILGIEPSSGRTFTDADDRGASVVIVNETMARLVWPGEPAVGKCIRIGFDADFDPQAMGGAGGPPMPSESVPCREVVGVTRDTRQRSVLPDGGEDRLMQYFVPFSQTPTPPFVSDPVHIRGLLIRTTERGNALAPAIRRLLVANRDDLPYLRVRPYADLLARQMTPWNVGIRIFGLLSALALFTAAIGLYAAFAQAVSERRREMAIRLSVGARPAGVRTLVLREATKIATVGAGFGIVAAVMAGRSAESLLFGTTPTDPLVLFASGSLMILGAAAAALPSAIEASRTDPSVLLRSE